ncbi:hypothetical protein AWB98_12715 [Mycolicibacterium conceptionense]|uniref:Tyr recombinase domain-containing protein n=1 Tax=Mycolicibacterium conceptionense TaxID=451644 RepID=A0ABX3V896_9MYCO|nr:hypothetical protein AWB98_12715 [Mycolicibacterium conceptionense]
MLANRAGGWISSSNIASALREALAPYEHLRWVTPHSFGGRWPRWCGTAALGAEAAQQQLSHAQLSTVEGRYVQRVTAGPDTRAVLDKWASNGSN